VPVWDSIAIDERLDRHNFPPKVVFMPWRAVSCGASAVPVLELIGCYQGEEVGREAVAPVGRRCSGSSPSSNCANACRGCPDLRVAVGRATMSHGCGWGVDILVIIWSYARCLAANDGPFVPGAERWDALLVHVLAQGPGWQVSLITAVEGRNFKGRNHWTPW